MPDLEAIKISASQHRRSKNRWPLDQAFLTSATSNLVCKLLRYPHTQGFVRDNKFQHFEKRAHSSAQSTVQQTQQGEPNLISLVPLKGVIKGIPLSFVGQTLTSRLQSMKIQFLKSQTESKDDPDMLCLNSFLYE